jgi:hypothetical protein
MSNMTEPSNEIPYNIDFEGDIQTSFEKLDFAEEDTCEKIDPSLNYTVDDFGNDDSTIIIMEQSNIKDIIRLSQIQLIKMENFVKSQEEVSKKIFRSYTPGRDGEDIKDNHKKLLSGSPGCITSGFLYGYRSIVSYCSINNKIYHWEENLGEFEEGSFEY